MKKITQCRACGSRALTRAFRLPAPSVVQPAQRGFAGRCGELEFLLCDPSKDAGACGLVQASHVGAGAPAREPAARYALTRSHLRAVATEALEMISGRDCAALDIGCNDGTLLSFYPRWVERYGVDTSPLAEEIGDWAWSARAAFPSTEIDAAFGDKKFDLITAVSILETLEAPAAFLARVKSLLAEDGVVVLETLYAPAALTRTCIEAFLGGAVGVYSLETLERLARGAGLRIFRGVLTDKEGGSIRLFLTHEAVEEYDFDPWYERLARLWDEENALSLRSLQSYQAFEARALDAREAFRSRLAEISANGESVHLLGAGPQSEALLAWAGDQAGVVSALVAPGKTGPRRKGAPPTISETDSRAAEPDYYLAPASLKREMLERWRESILLGAKLLFASPTLHVVHRQNYAAELGKALAGGDNAGGVETLRAILGAAGGPRLVAENPAAQVASG